VEISDVDLSDLSQWWQNRRAQGGLRLSVWAHNQLLSWSAPCWTFDIDPAWITPRNMLRMDRLIPVPYSLDVSNRPRRCWVTVWDSGQAMTIELLGDFDRFLAALERAWPRSPEKK
jgi:hypothetical protein